MKLKDIREKIGENISVKELKKIMLKITPADFKKVMKKKNGSIIELIKSRIKQHSL